MTVRDILEAYQGTVKLHNTVDGKDIGLIESQYMNLVSDEYLDLSVEYIEVELLNTAVLSARLVLGVIIVVDDNPEPEPEDPEDLSEEPVSKEDLLPNVPSDEEIDQQLEYLYGDANEG